MKKLLAIIMGILCFCNVVIFTACDGSGNSTSNSAASPSGSTASAASDSPSDSATPNSSTPDSTTFENSMGGNNAREENQNEGNTDNRAVIQIKPDGAPFTEDRTENIIIRNLPKTDTKFDVENFDFSFNYTNANLSWIELKTDNIDNVFAFFDAKCRKLPSNRNGLLMLPNADDVERWNVNYVIKHKFSNVIGDDMNDTFEVRCYIDGYIQLPDGREYYTMASFSPEQLMQEASWGTKWYYESQDPLRYICYDDNAFLTQSYLAYPKTSLGSGASSNTHCTLGIYYQSDNAENPYKENMVPSNFNYYYANIQINIEDGSMNNPNNNPELTEEEAQLVYGQLYDAIKNSFVVYDYEHYSKQFDGEK